MLQCKKIGCKTGRRQSGVASRGCPRPVCNLAKHGINFVTRETVFDSLPVTDEDDREAYDEQPLKSPDWPNGRVVILIWTQRNAAGNRATSEFPGLSLETLIVIPVKTGIPLFQRLAGFPLARERRKANVLDFL